MLEGSTLMSPSSPTEGADAGRSRLVRGGQGVGRLVLRRGKPFPRRGLARIIPVFGFQLLNPGVDSIKALADLLPTSGPGLRLAFHLSSMPAASGWRYVSYRDYSGLPPRFMVVRARSRRP